jgi:aminoglycoside phosphotransferase (APT) family kinase protein
MLIIHMKNSILWTMADTDTASAFDLARLARWMDRQGLAPGSEIPQLSRLSGGSQNELYVVTRARHRSVMRIPPATADARRHDGLRRELTLLSALQGTDVPHAELVAGCADADVLGAPFFLMSEIDGWSPAGTTGWPAPYDTHPDQRGPLAYGLVEGAARLSRVDWKARGLANFGRPDNFHDRQVDRWLAFLGAYRFRDLPGLDEASQWLRGNRPRHWEPGIMHGDYQFANVMFSHDVPARLAAIIDWEMATIGDPLLDLAWALIAWGPEADDMAAARYLSLDGMPSRDDLLQHYETISGRSTEDIDYYIVLARWKLGIVLEMSYARFVSGGAAPQLESFGVLVLELIRKAAELARSMPARSA